MKKLVLYGVIASLSISMLGCTKPTEEVVKEPPKQVQEQEQNNEEIEKSHIVDIVRGFGSKLQYISLLSPEEELADGMKEHYGEFATESLIEEWLNNPEDAPGRLVSSPWPDRIEVDEVEKINDDLYKVTGNIIEITNTDDNAATRAITLEVENIDNTWLISNVELGE